MVTRWSRTEKIVLIDVHDIVAKRQIDSGLARSVLLSKTIFVITNVKICCGITTRSILTAFFFKLYCDFVSHLLSVTMLIKVLCEQTRELTDELHDFLDYV